MGMIMAGITEGLGNGITAVAHNAAAMDAALAKAQQAKEIQDMKAQMATYSDNRLKGVEGRIVEMGAGGGKGGEADPDIQTPERARMLAAMDLGIRGDQAAQLEEYASTGKAPTIQQQYLAAVLQKDKFDADPSAQGMDAGGKTEDYSDAATRRLQHESGVTPVYETRTVVDPAFSDFYAKNAGAAANSYRKSFQPKEYQSMADGDSEKQKQGLISSVMYGGPGAARAVQVLGLANGDPNYTNLGAHALVGANPSSTRTATPIHTAPSQQQQQQRADIGKQIKLPLEQAMSKYQFSAEDVPPNSMFMLADGNVLVRGPDSDVTIMPRIRAFKPPPPLKTSIAAAANSYNADAPARKWFNLAQMSNPGAAVTSESAQVKNR